MDTFFDIIAAFGKPRALAAASGIDAGHVRVMKARDSIPPEYWPAVVEAAKAYGIAGVSLDKLAEIAGNKSRDRRSAAARKARSGKQGRATGTSLIGGGV